MTVKSLCRAAALALTAVTALTGQAAIPSGYYDSCEGKCGQALLEALEAKINSHTTVSYDNLWDVYATSDLRDDGTVWDIYSTKHWVVGKEHCGNYSVVGDCINKEHSFPKSWFGGKVSPMYSDAFHLYPTDGKVNGQRSSYPYGECANGTTLASNGSVQALGKLGTSTFSGYTGKVFEPDDEFKGDLARGYFYMAACYNSKIASWSSDMLAGNSYPAFSTWAVNLLMKWHGQDPVSAKETTRNEAVYKHQKNRNPFIDYPSLADHIWGDKKDEPWSSTESADPAIATPINGSTVNMGVTAVGHTISTVITVKGSALTADVTATVSGAGFSLSPSTLSKTDVTGSGAQLTVSLTPTATGTATGTLTLTSGSLTTTVTLSANVMDGIPVEATDITDSSFILRWTNLESSASANYTVKVWLDGELVSGYPAQVASSAQQLTVTDLEPSTTYTCQVTSSSLSSKVLTVATSAPVPSIQFLYDGDLYFTTAPGVASDPAEILLDIENIDTDINLSCDAPFEMSTDKTTWTSSINISSVQDRFYLRVYSAQEGEFSTDITATAGDYSTDIEVNAKVSSDASFIEGFDTGSISSLGSYNGGTYEGNTCSWTLVNAGIFGGSDPYHSELRSVRFGKTGAASVTMAADKEHGVGYVNFWARRWNGDGVSTINVDYSTDGGNSWTTAGSATIEEVDSDNKGVWKQYSIDVSVPGNVRIRLERSTIASSAPSAGGLDFATSYRLNLDDVSLTDCVGASSVQGIDYHSWDAFCRDGKLTIENSAADNHFIVYSIDGITYYDATPGIGTFNVSLQPGIYVVAATGFTRLVLVK